MLSLDVVRRGGGSLGFACVRDGGRGGLRLNRPARRQSASVAFPTCSCAPRFRCGTTSARALLRRWKQKMDVVSDTCSGYLWLAGMLEATWTLKEECVTKWINRR
eukprot:8519864-Pyramimonas_sp.AAC.3